MKKRALQKKKRELCTELKANKALIADEQRKGTAIHKDIIAIDKELNRGNLAVSDHAVLRYMERIQGVDVEAIRNEIIDSIPCIDQAEGIKDMSVFKFNHKLVVKDNVVVTISPK